MVVIVVVMSSINSQVVIVVIMRLSLGSLCYSIWKDFLGKSSPENLEKVQQTSMRPRPGTPVINRLYIVEKKTEISDTRNSVLDIPEA